MTKNLIGLLERSVRENSSRIAIQGEGYSYTYAEFGLLTDLCGGMLIEKGVSKGDHVGVCLFRSAEMVVGIFGTLKAGACYVPADPSYPLNRIKSTFQDANVRIVITTPDLAGYISSLGFDPFIPELVPWDGPKWVLPEIEGHDTAYVMYTSGSTGLPKGVIVEHHSVVNLVTYMQKQYPIKAGSRILFKSPFTFDGSVWELFGWVEMGGCLVIAEQGDEKDPQRLVRVIKDYRIAFVFFVPSMLGSFLDYLLVTNDHNLADSLRWVSVGGEVLPPAMVEKFYQLFNGDKTGLINVYGPTETTVYATTYLCQPGVPYKKVPIGFPVENNSVYILNKDLEPVKPGEEGEICIGGEGVAKGYLNQRDLTDEKFVPNPFGHKGYLYRTGDFGRQINSGLFDFIGRGDYQVKLRGLRIELGEVEYAMSLVPFIKQCCVRFGKDLNNDDCLIAYCIPHDLNGIANSLVFWIAEENFSEAINDQLLKSLPGFMVPAYYIFCRYFPLSDNGKIDTKQLPDLSDIVRNEAKEDFSPQGMVAPGLFEIWKDLLGRKYIGPADTFFRAGGNSIKAIQLVIALKSRFDVDLPLKELYNEMTLGDMCAWVESNSIDHSHEEKISLPLTEKKFYPLTPVQEEMWTMNSFDTSGIIHNIQIEFELKGKIDLDRFIDALKSTILSEEVFCSVFPAIDGIPVQVFMDDVKFDLPVRDISGYDQKRKEDEYQIIWDENGRTKFNLEKLPLFSLVLVKWLPDAYRLLFAVHHLIFDGWSLYLFIKLVHRYYMGGKPVVKKFRNSDYAIWLKNRFKSENRKSEEEFWKSALYGISEKLDLPYTSNSLPNILVSRGQRSWWCLDKQQSLVLDQKSSEFGVTPFSLFFGAYSIALSMISGQSDLVIGTPYANRHHPMVADLIGYYTNLVPIRCLIN